MILDFFKISSNLKNIPRQGWIDKLSLKHPESVADHTYSMTMMSMIISDMENFNSEKILKMSLLHDLAESKIGDFTPEQIDSKKKIQLENNAFNEIMKTLPEKIRSSYLELWKEYQENISSEAKIIHQIDKLEMVIQAKMYQNQGHPKEKLNSFYDSAKKEITNTKLKELFTEIMSN
ncbi:MAG: HD domain-containing protein [Thaumarchaeota archaeon]|jgi:putative hydrolase of HD superfamily|nr:HD domain-containing protein [Nitrososphaerota archaeon]MBT5842651.1 HD domain-containing protein [Nitrososphaerota archaeon]MBT6468181.1 HD domain-containing protein [Nitrososphaerota archaeon]